MSTAKLIEAAAQVRASAHPPYSTFSIGAALLSGTTQEFSLTDLLPRPKQGILE